MAGTRAFAIPRENVNVALTSRTRARVRECQQFVRWNTNYGRVPPARSPPALPLTKLFRKVAVGAFVFRD
jgi:hypothetical protein